MHKRLIHWFVLFSIAFFSLIIVQDIGYCQKQRKLKISIVGSIDNDDPQYNPFVICNPKEVKLLLLKMAESPMKNEEIESFLSHSKTKIDDLLRLEIIRQEEDLYYLNFPLFTEKDEAMIMQVAERYGQLLAGNILEKKSRIYELLAEYQPSNIGKDKLAFVAVGCLSLDLGALRLLAGNDYIIHKPEKPGGNHYILSGKEVTEFSLKEIYWGCHSDTMNGIMFMTFGDHDAGTKRYGFPDILWGVGGKFFFNVPEFYREELLALFDDQLDSLMRKIGRVLYILKNSPLDFEKIKESSSVEEKELKHILNFLIKINYVTVKEEAYSLAIPVFGRADREMLNEIQKIVNDEILSWTESYYEQIKLDLKDISAVKNGVDYKEIFNMLWHFFFGLTNKFLARSGFIYDTYRASEQQKGYLPAVLLQKF